MIRTLLWACACALAIRLVLMAVLPLSDPTEGRYANTGREMVLSGDWITPQVWLAEGLTPFLGKPPLHFWGEALCIKILGANEFAVRLPAWIAGLGLLAIMWVVLARHRNRNAAAAAVAIAGTSVLFWGLAGAVATDMTLTATASGAVLCYMAFIQAEHKRERDRFSLAVFALLALAFMTKGPIGLVMFGLPVFLWTALNRRRETLRGHAWCRGIALFLAMTVPWFVLSEMRNPGFLRYFFVNENFLRFTTPDYGDLYGNGHIYPRGSAIPMSLLAALPWSLALPFFLWRHRGKAERREMLADPTTGLAFLGVVGITLFWCLARQLLITYLLPAVPLFAVWLACQPLQQKALSAVAWGTVSVMLTGAIVGGIVLTGSVSLKRALDKVRQTERDEEYRLLFVRHTPYSAFFYARNQVIPRPKDKVNQSVEASKTAGGKTLLVFKKKYLDRVSAEERTRMETVVDSGDWIFVRWKKATSPTP